MKTRLILFLSFFAIFYLDSYSQKLVKVWESPKNFQVPESVLYDEPNDIIFVSNMGGGGQNKDGNGFISKMTTAGKIKDLKWVEGLNGPTGMGIFGNTLYVADIDQVVGIDIPSGKIIGKYDAEGAKLLNDLTVRMNGDVFISDSNTGKIYVLQNGKLSVWIENNQIKYPNGLLAEQGKLLVGENSVFEVDLISKEIKVVADAGGGGIDGLERDNRGRILFSHWNGKIFIVVDGKPVLMLDTSSENINSADIDFAFKPGLLLVPTFNDNRIFAYKIVD
jgi:hypothetical protein